MKNRFRLLGYHMLFYSFNRNVALVVFWLVWLLITTKSYPASLLLTIFLGAILSIIICLTFVNYGKSLVCIIEPFGNHACIHLTMRGNIRTAKAIRKGNKDNIINSWIQEDFESLLLLLKTRKINRAVIIRTHIIYSQGVLDTLFKVYDSPLPAPNLRELFRPINKADHKQTISCDGKTFYVEKTGRHLNVMASIKTPVYAEQKCIDHVFRTKCTFFNITIPKDFFIEN